MFGTRWPFGCSGRPLGCSCPACQQQRIITEQQRRLADELFARRLAEQQRAYWDDVFKGQAQPVPSPPQPPPPAEPPATTLVLEPSQWRRVEPAAIPLPAGTPVEDDEAAG